MAINEVTVTGRKFRKLVDETAKLWQRISFWTKASDVEFEDGKNAETKLGMINGITSDINGDSDNIAASIKVVNELNNNLGGCSLAQEGNDFYIVGADSVRKKLGNTFGKGILSMYIGAYDANVTSNVITSTYTIPSNCDGDAFLIFNNYTSYNNLAGYCTSILVSGSGVKKAEISHNPNGSNKTPSIYRLSCKAGGTITITMSFQHSVSHAYVYGAPAIILY